jgi:hypothetical protein
MWQGNDGKNLGSPSGQSRGRRRPREQDYTVAAQRRKKLRTTVTGSSFAMNAKQSVDSGAVMSSVRSTGLQGRLVQWGMQERQQRRGCGGYELNCPSGRQCHWTKERASEGMEWKQSSWAGVFFPSRHAAHEGKHGGHSMFRSDVQAAVARAEAALACILRTVARHDAGLQSRRGRRCSARGSRCGR